jgi:lipopolysaccharide biosynthesis protein
MRFVQRWEGQINAGDLATYSRDGMAVTRWREDSADNRREGLGAGQAILEPAPPPLKVAVVVHVFYLELWPEISGHLSKLDSPFDVHITCCVDHQNNVGAAVLADFPDAHIHPYPNRGMDMVPFLLLIPSLKAMGYGLVCKLHTKRGVKPLGDVWRKYLLESLIGSAASVRDVIEAFNMDPLLAQAGPSALYLSAHTTMYENRAMLERLASAMERPPALHDDWGFFAGSMGWIRMDSLTQLALAATRIIEFNGQLRPALPNADGGWPHALERAMGWSRTEYRVAIIGEDLSQTGRTTSSPSMALRILFGNELKQNIHQHHASEMLWKIFKAKSQHHGRPISQSSHF